MGAFLSVRRDGATRGSPVAPRSTREPRVATSYCLMQYRCSTPRRNRAPPATAGDDQNCSLIVFFASTLNSGPAWSTCVVPASSRQNTLPSYAHGDDQKARAFGIRSRWYAGLPVFASKQLTIPPLR